MIFLPTELWGLCLEPLRLRPQTLPFTQLLSRLKVFAAWVKLYRQSYRTKNPVSCRCKGTWYLESVWWKKDQARLTAHSPERNVGYGCENCEGKVKCTRSVYLYEYYTIGGPYIYPYKSWHCLNQISCCDHIMITIYNSGARKQPSARCWFWVFGSEIFELSIIGVYILHRRILYLPGATFRGYWRIGAKFCLKSVNTQCPWTTFPWHFWGGYDAPGLKGNRILMPY